jgi:copper chaperone CopZ
MQTKQVSIPAISCGHCVNTVQNEVKAIAGVVSVKADAASKLAVIEWDAPATWEQINATLVEIEYPPQELMVL